MPSKARNNVTPTNSKRQKNHVDKLDEAKGAVILPENWPEDVVFLEDHTYSLAVTAEMRSGMSKTTRENSDFERIALDILNAPLPIEIQIIKDDKHPAFGQRGLFAVQHVDPNSFLCLYLGHVHTNSMSDTDSRSDYDLNLDGELGLSIDAQRCGNHARFANDYRSIADRPNSEFRDIFIRVPCSKRSEGMKWERRVAIFSLSAGKANKRKGIRAGEEILVSYGKSYWTGRQLLAKFRQDFEMLKIAEKALEH